MDNNFTPQTAFEGYVKASLDFLTDRLNALPCKMQDERIRNVEQKVSNIQGKASVFGALGGIISYLIGKFMGK